MIKPQFETYRYTSEICNLQSQSMVECRLSGSEVGSILATTAFANLTESTCENGVIKYSGKLIVTVVYEDSDGNVCKVERGVEFSHKAEHSEVSPACFANIYFSTENISYRREGAGVYISVIVMADITLFGGKKMEYFIGGENIVTKQEPTKLCYHTFVVGEYKGEDEFETEELGDILLHNQQVLITRAQANAGEIEVEGELCVSVCELQEAQGICTYERIIPFKSNVPCEEAYNTVNVGVKGVVKDVQLNVVVDEDKGKSKILFSYAIGLHCQLYVQEEISVASDCFSTACNLAFDTVQDSGGYLTNCIKGIERISGSAICNPALEGEFTLKATATAKAELTCKKTGDGFEVEGVILAQLFFVGEDGGHRSAVLSLPCLFPVSLSGDSFEVEGLVCGLNVKRRKSGEVEAEAVLKYVIKEYERYDWTYIANVTEGEALVKKQNALSIFLPVAGESLWEVAKRLKCTPEQVEKNNAGLEFPIKEGERIFVYRKID